MSPTPAAHILNGLNLTLCRQEKMSEPSRTMGKKTAGAVLLSIRLFYDALPERFR